MGTSFLEIQISKNRDSIFKFGGSYTVSKRMELKLGLKIFKTKIIFVGFYYNLGNYFMI
jgi:hypothetical protein